MSRATPRLFLNNLQTLGYELKAIDEDQELRPRKLFRQLSRRGLEVESTNPTAQSLRAHNFSPDIMIDIGVDRGTPMIYDAFSDAKFLLIDPLSESEERCEIFKDQIDFSFHVCALGAKEGTVTIKIPSTESKVRTSRATAMDFEGRNKDQFASFEERDVPMRKLDRLTSKLEGSIGIKIDTEGFELEVMKGAKNTLKRTEFVLAEANVKRRYVDGYRFSDLVAFMGKQGFEILDFPRPIRPEADDCDVLFARYDSDRFNF